MDQILQGLPVVYYLDDILVAGSTKKEHDEQLEQVLKCLDEQGIHLQREKCEFCKTEVEYLGHRIDAKGIHPTVKKVEAIKRAPQPQDVSQLREFVGLMSYYGKFILQISTLLAPLYKLLEKDHTWNWTPQCEEAFGKCQSVLSSSAVLVHYDDRTWHVMHHLMG